MALELQKTENEKNQYTFFCNLSSVMMHCLYATMFGIKQENIIQYVQQICQKELGMTDEQFRNTSFYSECITKTKRILSIMANFQIMLELKDLVTNIKNQYMDKDLIGPTGHAYLVTEDTFPHAYLNFLTIYELTIFCYAILKTIDSYNNKYKDKKHISVLAHYTENTIVLVPGENVQYFIELFQNYVNEIMSQLNLKGSFSYKITDG